MESAITAGKVEGDGRTLVGTPQRLRRRRSGDFRPGGILGPWRSWVLFVVVAAVYVSTGTYGGNQNRDTISAAVAAWALGARHTLDLSFLHMARMVPSPFWIVRGAHGWLITNRFPGAILVAAPLYAIAGGWYNPVPATVAAALTAAGAVAILYKVLRRLLPAEVALAGAALFAFGTATWTVAGRELWEHSGSELLLAAGMLGLLNRRWVLSGLAFGTSVLFRPDLALVAGVVGLGILMIERRWSPALRFGAAAVPGALGLLTWNWFAYGRLTVTGGYSGVHLTGQGPVRLLQSIAGNLVSPERGLLVCTPGLVVAAVGLVEAWRRSVPQVRLLALAGLVSALATLWWTPITPHSDAFMTAGDDFVGNRYCLEALMLAAPLLVDAGSLGARRIGRFASWGLAALSIAFFSAGAFVQGESWGVGVDPWTHWAPRDLSALYGVFPTVLGGAIGLLAVATAFALFERRGTTLFGSLRRRGDCAPQGTVLEMHSSGDVALGMQ
jgi:hypothetical protein